MVEPTRLLNSNPLCYHSASESFYFIFLLFYCCISSKIICYIYIYIYNYQMTLILYLRVTISFSCFFFHFIILILLYGVIDKYILEIYVCKYYYREFKLQFCWNQFGNLLCYQMVTYNLLILRVFVFVFIILLLH